MNTIMKMMANMMAMSLLFVGAASADTWNNVERSFNIGFADNHPRKQVAWNLVADSFDRGFNDGYAAPEREAAVARAKSETDLGLLALVSFERMLGEDLYHQNSGRSEFDIAALGWEETISKAELYAGAPIKAVASK